MGRWPLVLLGSVVSATVWAQGGAEPPEDWAEAIELPREAKELRDLGVPSDEVRTALQAARAKRMKGSEARALMREGRSAAGETGPVDNFGAFVQARLDEGLRGQDLAAAIRAEHQARGIGKGKRIERGDRPPEAGQRPGAPEGMDREHPGADRAKAKLKAKADGGGH
jgi:hypothetical protein